MVSRTEKNKIKRKKIKSEEKSEKRKKIFLKTIKIILFLSIILVSLSLYIYYVSTRQLMVKEYSKKYNIPKEYHGFKIIQFGELYYDQNYYDMIRKLKNTINNIKPDIVIFTGGLTNNKYNVDESVKEYISKNLKDINAKLGKYFITSKNDDETTIEILNNSNFKYIDNSNELIYYNTNTPIKISGIIDSYTNLENKDNYFHIVITNNPDNIESILNKVNPNIIMAGYNLNSQVRIPYYGALFKTNTYIDSYYKIDNTDIYITGGIGTNNYPIRIFNHPSINFYRLLSENK